MKCPVECDDSYDEEDETYVPEKLKKKLEEAKKV